MDAAGASVSLNATPNKNLSYRVAKIILQVPKSKFKFSRSIILLLCSLRLNLNEIWEGLDDDDRSAASISGSYAVWFIFSLLLTVNPHGITLGREMEAIARLESGNGIDGQERLKEKLVVKRPSIPEFRSLTRRCQLRGPSFPISFHSELIDETQKQTGMKKESSVSSIIAAVEWEGKAEGSGAVTSNPSIIPRETKVTRKEWNTRNNTWIWDPLRPNLYALRLH